jgi:hypothetical protein
MGRALALRSCCTARCSLQRLRLIPMAGGPGPPAARCARPPDGGHSRGAPRRTPAGVAPRRRYRPGHQSRDPFAHPPNHPARQAKPQLMPQYAPVRPGRHVRAGEFRTIPICPSLRGWPAPGTAALSGFPPRARDVAGSRSRPSQDLPACLAAGIWFAGRAGQARTADSNGGNRRLASAIDSSAGRSHISPPLGICHAWKADGRRAIGVQLATVKRGQSRVLRVSEVGCSAASSAAICPIPKLTVRGCSLGCSSPPPGAIQGRPINDVGPA